ncbi:hypothetical protein LOK49_LG02G01414 [Camellia lanceoleosa]|uniref:Uncharacterized protein n=1 Tax=Camellia lanceoleosa TaxID=1840588 RepID=A0ACC0IPM6_9ERIC|nr:hypothetical protein LOK49_LG02G01414 [Camellia lanceoleosa]
MAALSMKNVDTEVMEVDANTTNCPASPELDSHLKVIHVTSPSSILQLEHLDVSKSLCLGLNGDNVQEQQHLKHVPSSTPPTMGEHLEPNSQMELVGHSIVLTSYPYPDPHYRGIMAYGAHIGMQAASDDVCRLWAVMGLLWMVSASLTLTSSGLLWVGLWAASDGVFGAVLGCYLSVLFFFFVVAAGQMA